MNPANEGEQNGGEEPIRSLPKPGDHKTITMATIAKAAGVSQGAISSLLNDRDYGIRVSEKTRERVFRVCREMGYVPNDLRAVVRMYPHLGDTCLLVSSSFPSVTTDPFISRIAQGAMSGTAFCGQPVTIARYDPSFEYEYDSESLPHPVKAGVASRFITVGPPNPSLFQAIIRRGFPVICLGYEVATPGVSSLMPDYTSATKIAIQYLSSLGHKRIVILPGPFGTTDRAMIELNRGIKLGYDTVNLPVEAQNLIYGELTFKTGFEAVELLISRNTVPTAILCLSDTAAAGALAAAHAHGLTTDQLSIMGCGDDSTCHLVHPALTTIRFPAEEMGAEAVKEAEKRIANEDLTSTNKIVLPVSLVERASCVAPK